MFGFNKKRREDGKPAGNDGARGIDGDAQAPDMDAMDEDVTVPFPVDERTVEALDELRPDLSHDGVDAMSVIDTYLSASLDQGAKAVHDEEDVIEEADEIDLRLYSLNDVIMHYYLSCYRSWLDAMFTALDEVPALCLSVPGSPIEYLGDPAEADKIAEELGYADWAVLSEMASKKLGANPFLSRFASSTLEFAKRAWFEDIEEVPPADYAEAIVSELRANLPGIKASAGSLLERIFEQLPDGRIETEDGTRAVICGIETVDALWNPVSMVVAPEGDWDATYAKKKDYDAAKKGSADAGEGIFDEGILSVAYLQSYIWSNRSWNKASELGRDFLNSCFTFSMACISPEYGLVDIEKTEQNSIRIDELAQELMNDDGQVELRQVRPGSPTDVSTLDETSREFVMLNEEQAHAQFISDVNQVIVNLMPALSGTKQTVADMVVDEILACVWATADLTSTRSQEEALQRLHDDVLAAFDAKAKAFKAAWKKKIANDEELAEKVKEGRVISDYVDGEVAFA